MAVVVAQGQLVEKQVSWGYLSVSMFVLDFPVVSRVLGASMMLFRRLIRELMEAPVGLPMVVAQVLLVWEDSGLLE